jgi:hypothetical protein
MAGAYRMLKIRLVGEKIGFFCPIIFKPIKYEQKILFSTSR